MRTHRLRLAFLHDNGFSPNTIIDIGANVGDWTLMAASVFPDCEFLMIEANEEHRTRLNRVADHLTQTGKKTGLEVCLLGDRTGREVTFYTSTRPSSTGHSIYRENTPSYNDENVRTLSLKMRALDDLVEQRRMERIDLVKIDVQGAELDILRGAPTILERQAPLILLEIQFLNYNEGAPKYAEVIGFMDSIGYEPVDLFEIHYLKNGYLSENDILFARKGSAKYDVRLFHDSKRLSRIFWKYSILIQGLTFRDFFRYRIKYPIKQGIKGLFKA
jgi:FkbM family methyltransferase